MALAAADVRLGDAAAAATTRGDNLHPPPEAEEASRDLAFQAQVRAAVGA